MRSRWIVGLALAVLSGCSEEPLDVAEDVDLARFQGKWYEIAKLPRPTQADCTGTTAFYSFREGGLDGENQCHLAKLDGELRTRSARATVADGSAKLAIDVGGFSGDYWILEVGPSYEYAVIGVPSRDYLWILSRTPKLDQGTLDGVVERMRAAKFDTGKLEYTIQAP